MKYDENLIEEAVLALLVTFSTDNGNTWKGYDFEITNRLHEHEFVRDPVNKSKSIWLTPERMEQGRQIADRLIGVRTQAERVSKSDT